MAMLMERANSTSLKRRASTTMFLTTKSRSISIGRRMIYWQVSKSARRKRSQKMSD